ncbi:MAG: geranylgeranylglycerol-phosphate geranylgeranyltransferase [Melioribacteraceae bacterium]|nr:geranylgeranylglycerol-phosphate geranylgeranyltransferase [Melioribacteraceae bacterium]
MIKNVHAFFSIIRPVNVLITFAAVFIAGIICSGQYINHSIIIYAALSQSFLAASAYVINDIFDIKIDYINRPDRVLVKENLSKTTAYFYYSVLSIISIIFTFFIDYTAVIIIFISILLIFLYSARLKSIPLLGNIVVSFFTGVAIVFGGYAVDNWEYAVIPGVFAFLINLIRELLKDIEDIKGDKFNNTGTFPIKFGVAKTKNLIFIISTLLILFTFYPFITEYYHIEYFVIVICFVNLPLLYFIKILKSYNEQSQLRNMSNLLKLIMIFGLFAIFMGS